MTLRLSSLFLFILSVSCQPNQPQSQVQTDGQQSDTILSGSNSELITSAHKSRSESNSSVVPVTAVVSQEIKILFTGTFHGDEVEEDASEWSWFGLFTDDDGDFLLTKTKIVAQRVVDSLLDDEEKGEKTGWEISTESGQYPTILISGSYVTEGKVEGAEVPATLYPGDSVQFEFKGIHYRLYATGSSHLDSLSGISYVSDYTLSVVQTGKGRTRQTELVSHASFDDAMTSILWSGDLDHDGYLDFVIDMSRHYNQRLPTLFLSKPAGEYDAVIPVAEHSSVGC